MINSLIDAGPLIALFDKDDKFHERVHSFLSEFKGHLYTTFPVLTEAMHMLSFNIQVQLDFLRWVHLGAVHIVKLESYHLQRIIELSEKYSDVPMDFADSTLVLSSELLKIYNIVTFDSDYYIYRAKRKKVLKNLLDSSLD